MTANRFIETGDGLTVAPPEDLTARAKALTKRLDALVRKEGEGAAPASGPTADSVHVPTADMTSPPKRKKRATVKH